MRNILQFKLLVTISILLFITNSCNWIAGEDDKLSLERRPYLGNELRLDGFYYQVLTNGNWYVLFFNRNGIIRSAASILTSELQNIDSLFRSEKWNKNASDKLAWGVFHIDSNKIKTESWCPSDVGGLPVYTEFGEIMNDSTFHISRSQRVDGSDAKTRDYLFHFRQFAPKLDSITEFIP